MTTQAEHISVPETEAADWMGLGYRLVYVTNHRNADGTTTRIAHLRRGA